MATLTQVARYILACELLLGGQARISARFTPQVHQKAMAKAAGYKKYLPFIPGHTPTEHSRNIGVLMFLAGVGMFLSQRLPKVLGTALGTALAAMGIYSQSRMGVPFWLPCVNAMLGSLVLSDELGRSVI